MHDLIKRLKATSQFINNKLDTHPEYGIILGSGLGKLADRIEIDLKLPYSKIPHFPLSTVPGHAGNLIFGKLSGKSIVALQGLFHFYEGYEMPEVVYPIRVMKMLGVHTLIISNAAGGINPDYNAGDLMVVKDHISFQPANPLRGINWDELGPRFPDMSKVYDEEMRKSVQDIAKQNNITCHEGVYIGVQGPSLETPAEYKMFHIMGADAIGMSTVPEVIAARHMDMKVAVLSVISNEGYPPERQKYTTHEEVVAMAEAAEPKLRLVVQQLIESL